MMSVWKWGGTLAVACVHVCLHTTVRVTTPLLHQVDQVCKIVEVLGIPPSYILERASRTEKFFEKGPSGNWILRRPRDGRKVRVVLA